MMLSTPR